MARLKTLRPRLAEQKNRLATAAPGSWRSGLTSNQRGYNYRWQQARERFLFANPLCVYCKAKGRVTAATVVDHIVPHRGDMDLFWDQSLWQPLCASCHSAVKQREESSEL